MQNNTSALLNLKDKLNEARILFIIVEAKLYNSSPVNASQEQAINTVRSTIQTLANDIDQMSEQDSNTLPFSLQQNEELLDALKQELDILDKALT